MMDNTVPESSYFWVADEVTYEGKDTYRYELVEIVPVYNAPDQTYLTLYNFNTYYFPATPEEVKKYKVGSIVTISDLQDSEYSQYDLSSN